MTKVQIRFKFSRPLDEAQLALLSDTTSFYGIQRVMLTPSMDGVMVEYDATRLRPAEVESALTGVGIPIERE